MNAVIEAKTNPIPVVIDETTARILPPANSPPFSFPIGYYELHPDININFQLNRFFGWVGDDSMLTEMREAVTGVNDYPTFTKVILDLGEKALARHEVRKGAYYLRLAEFFMFTNDPRKLPSRKRFVDLLLSNLQIAPSAYSRIPFATGWLPAYRLTPTKPKGTLVVFGGFDSYIEEWMPAALFFRDAGYDSILFEGPGQGAALQLAQLPMIAEWEQPVKAVLDFFQCDAVTLMGFSLGGELGIRAAAFEPRVRRVIAYDVCTSAFGFLLRPLPPPVRQQLLEWLDANNEGAVNTFFVNARAKSLFVDWGTQNGMHTAGVTTPYEMLKHFQKYATAGISSRVTQDVLLMAGAEDHAIAVNELPDQIATLTHVRTLTARLFTRVEQAQNHCQVGNYGLAFRTIVGWMTGLGPIESATDG